MYFFKYEPLKKKLKKKELSDRQAIPYFVCFYFLATIGSTFPVEGQVNIWDIITGLAGIVIFILGLLYAYKNNGGSQGFDLIKKFVALSWIVFIRCILFIIIFMFLMIILGERFGLLQDDASNWYDLLVTSITEVFFWQRIGYHIRDTR